MTMTIDTSDRISIDGQQTGLALRQLSDRTVIYTPEGAGRAYTEHVMPHGRYSASHDTPRPMHATPELAAKYPPAAGRAQLEADLRALVTTL